MKIRAQWRLKSLDFTTFWMRRPPIHGSIGQVSEFCVGIPVGWALSHTSVCVCVCVFRYIPDPFRYALFVPGAFRYMIYRLVFQVFTPHTKPMGCMLDVVYYDLNVTRAKPPRYHTHVCGSNA